MEPLCEVELPPIEPVWPLVVVPGVSLAVPVVPVWPPTEVLPPTEPLVPVVVLALPVVFCVPLELALPEIPPVVVVLLADDPVAGGVLVELPVVPLTPVWLLPVVPLTPVWLLPVVPLTPVWLLPVVLVVEPADGGRLLDEEPEVPVWPVVEVEDDVLPALGEVELDPCVVCEDPLTPVCEVLPALGVPSVVVPALPVVAFAFPEMLPAVLSGGGVVVLEPLVDPLTPPVVPCVPVVDWLLSVELPTAPDVLPVSFSAVLSLDFLCFLACFLCLWVVVVLVVDWSWAVVPVLPDCDDDVVWSLLFVLELELEPLVWAVP